MNEVTIPNGIIQTEFTLVLDQHETNYLYPMSIVWKAFPRKDLQNFPHPIEIRIQIIGGRTNIRWYKAAPNDGFLDQVKDFIKTKFESLLARFKKKDVWHFSKSISTAALRSTPYSITTTRTSSRRKCAT